MSLQFGSFKGVCEQVALSLCPYISKTEGIEPICYSRNVEIAGTLLFQPATLIIHFIALVMTSVMIYHIKAKYTAVGRKEIVMFFYMFMACTFCEFLLVSAIIPTASSAYPYFAAIHVGLITATFWCLLLNGFVGFQFAEDGTPLSLWSIRISSLLVCAGTFVVAAATFQGWAGFDKAAPTALWIIYFVFNGAALVVYVVLQIVLVVNTLDDRWPLGDILFGSTFFIIGQVFLFAISRDICDTAKHYIDGLFFGTICNLLAVMMVYKYWDSITKEDLEFSVGGRQNVWLIDEVKESLLGEGEEYPPNTGSGFTGSTLGSNSVNGSPYYQQTQQSFNPAYGGGGSVYGNQQYPGGGGGYANGYE